MGFGFGWFCMDSRGYVLNVGRGYELMADNGRYRAARAAKNITFFI